MELEPKVYCYPVVKDDTNWFVYWIIETSLLGLTDMNDVYEVRLLRKERKMLLGNIAESLVDQKWTNTFINKALKVGSVSEKVAKLLYISRSIELPRNDQPTNSKKNLVNKSCTNVCFMLGEITTLRRFVLESERGPVPSTSRSPSTNFIDSVAQKDSSQRKNDKIQNSHRAPRKAKGLTFDSIVDADEEETRTALLCATAEGDEKARDDMVPESSTIIGEQKGIEPTTKKAILTVKQQIEYRKPKKAKGLVFEDPI